MDLILKTAEEKEVLNATKLRNKTRAQLILDRSYAVGYSSHTGWKVAISIFKSGATPTENQEKYLQQIERYLDKKYPESLQLALDIQEQRRAQLA